MVVDVPNMSSKIDTNSSERNSIKFVQELFERVVELIRKTDSAKSNYVTLSQAEQLRLYGLYKRCTVGRLVVASSSDASCSPAASNSSFNSSSGTEDMEDTVVCQSRPSFLQITSRYKYDAWLECSNKYHRKHEARLEYLEYALKLLFQSNSVDKDEVTLLHQELRTCLATAAPDRNKSPTTEEVEITHDKSLTRTRFFPLRTFIDSLKLYPRGTLDISWSDFLFATYYSLFYMLLSSIFPSSKEESIYQGLNERIELLWNEEKESKEDDLKPHILTSLSVRSAFDLYLQAKQYPPGSSIIMSAIQIEGMIRVAQYHGLTIIPVDCSSIDNVAPSISMIMEKVTSSTVAVLIAHAFGFVGYSKQELHSLKEQLQQFDHAIDLIEDCAECFPYRGSSSSDVVFVSFGVIKTSTALGGAVSSVQNHSVYAKMKQLQMHYKLKTNTYFLIHRVLKCSFLNWVSHSPLLCGIICKLCQHILGDASSYDKIITNSIKGFPLSSSKNSAKLLIELLRYRPSCANLALLYRRISSPIIERVIYGRANRCRQIIRDISMATTGTIKFPGRDEPTFRHNHYYWLLPIMVKNPDFVSQRLLKSGFDVPR
jgi:perosamine synthetase